MSDTNNQQHLHVIRSNCSSCKKYKPEYWVLGHRYCSSHRDCTGKREWLPNQCDACTKFIEEFPTLSGGEQHTAMTNLKAMLRKMARTRSRYGPWAYIEPLKLTFPDYYRVNSPPSAASPTNGTVGEGSAHHDQPSSPSRGSLHEDAPGLINQPPVGDPL